MSSIRYNEKRARARAMKSLNHLSFLDSNSISLSGLKILETGTGGTAIDPIMFFLSGADSIVTFDVLPILTLEKIKISAMAIIEAANHISYGIGCSEQTVASVCNRILEAKTLEAALGAIHTEYYLAENANPLTSTWPRSRIDMYFSESNLQRIPLENIWNHLEGIKRLMSEDGLFFHQIDCTDIVAQSDFRKVDRSLFPFYYLVFDDEQWLKMAPREQGSQNRLREFQFLEIFRRLDLSPILIESYTAPDDALELAKLDIEAKYLERGASEAAVGRSRILMRSNYSEEGARRIYLVQGRSYGAPHRIYKPEFGICSPKTENIEIVSEAI